MQITLDAAGALGHGVVRHQQIGALCQARELFTAQKDHGLDLSALEDETVLDETVEEVTCRWCGTGTAVEEIDADSPVVSATTSPEPPGAL